MAEHVEKELEKLLPTFWKLRGSGLLSKEELDTFIKHCRGYEYEIVKMNKSPKDFTKYAEYITETLALIGGRRAGNRNSYKTHPSEHIEKQLKYKCAFLYQLCSDRFKGQQYFEGEIAYLKSANLLGNCSQAYTRLLRLYGHLPENHVDAGRFEFFENKSGENARTTLQAALRKFPHYLPLWTTLFEVELGYVKFLIERRQHLLAREQGKRGKAAVGEEEDGGEMSDEPAEDVTDAVLQMKLADIVQQQALATVPEEKRSELIYQLWRIAAECGELAERLESQLYQQLVDHQPPVEESVLARLQRDRKQHYDLYETALGEMPTVRMVRIYVDYCTRRAELGDTTAERKLSHLLKRIHESGEASREEEARYEQLCAPPESVSRDPVGEKLSQLREAESRDGALQKSLVMEYEKLVAEWGSRRVDCWIRYVRYLMRAAPERVGKENERALLNLPSDLVEDFHAEWTRVMMGDVND